MGASARIVNMLLLVSAVIAVPTGDTRRSHYEDESRDLLAEPSEIIHEAVPPPHNRQLGLTTEVKAPDHSIELETGSQTFFPSFANIFEPRQHNNNFRLGFGNQEAAFSQRPNSYRSLLNFPVFGGGYRNLDNFGKHDNSQSAPLVDSSSVLGSGNFGIIRGGTFSAQNDEDDFDDDGFNYYNNGHGRPSFGVGYIANPRPNYNQDQFANFRDFADINTPSNAAFSQYVVVYANKNATVDEVKQAAKKETAVPKNIIETLERIDNTSEKAPSKLSKTKAKLHATKQKLVDKKLKWKKTNQKYSQKHDPEEPLLALS